MAWATSGASRSAASCSRTVNYQGLFAAGHTFNSVTGANIDISEYSYLIHGAAIVTFMLFRPEGLLPSARRKHELHEEEELDELIEAQPA